MPAGFWSRRSASQMGWDFRRDTASFFRENVLEVVAICDHLGFFVRRQFKK